MDRSELHSLVDSLPDGALDEARRVLNRLHSWPPPTGIERMRQLRSEAVERIRQSVVPGMRGGMSGGGNFDRAHQYGHSSHSSAETDAAMVESIHFFNGYEIAVTERLALAKDGNFIRYNHEAKGPDGDSHTSEIVFPV